MLKKQDLIVESIDSSSNF